VQRAARRSAVGRTQGRNVRGGGLKMAEQGLSHVEGGLPAMVDVGGKTATRRTAAARAVVAFPPEVMAELRRPAPGDLVGPKGPVFATAVVAGIQAAKRTWELIPLCHPLPLDGIQVTCSIAGDTVEVVCTAKAFHTTGVEMEA